MSPLSDSFLSTAYKDAMRATPRHSANGQIAMPFEQSVTTYGHTLKVDNWKPKEKENTVKIEEVLKERGTRYGSFFQHAKITQQLKSIFFSHMNAHNDASLTVDQKEAIEMIMHKLGRIANGDPNYVDSWVDIAGYAQLVADRILADSQEKAQGTSKF